MKMRLGISPCFYAVLLVLLFAVCPPAPALSQELEDVYIEEDQSHFKLEKGKRYHGKWTSEKPAAEKSPLLPQAGPQAPRSEVSKEQVPESPTSVSEPEPAQEQKPAPEAEKDMPAESTDAASYEKLQKAMKAEEVAGSSGETASQKPQASSGTAPAAGLEISDQPGVLSCKYMGLVYEDGRAMVRLKFTNNSEKEIQGIWGGFDIKDAAGKVIDATGVTDSVSIIKPGEDSSLTLFRYLELDADALNALKGASGKVELVFGVVSVGFTDGSKVDF